VRVKLQIPFSRWRSSTLLALALGVAAPAGAAPKRADEAQVASAVHGMVVSEQALASHVGAEVLKSGGNAIDAAVATALALAVVHPQAGNLGGGGFLLYYRARDSLCTAVDFREIAPLGAKPDMYLDAHGAVDTLRSRTGHLAAGVPGTPAGLHLAWSKYGRQSWRSLVAPAIRLAQDGFSVNADLAAAIAEEMPTLRRFRASADLFAPKGKPLKAGDRLVQKDLARTLRLLAQSGALTFYEGAIADLIVKESQRGHGIIGVQDLAAYRPIERVPLRGRYRDLDVRVMPPPSGGGTLLEMLELLEYYDLSAIGPRSTYRVHLSVEVMERAFADRNQWFSDPDYLRIPMTGLLSPQYIAQLQKGIPMDHATPPGGVRPGTPWQFEPGGLSTMSDPAAFDTLHNVPTRVRREGNHTTHLSVVDAEGNVVALTTTLNSNFGSAVLVEGAGFLLNNEMDDFVARPGTPDQYGLVGGDANTIGSGKRPLSSMSPTIVLRDHKPYLVLGSRGGPRILTTILNILLDVRDHHLSLEAAVANPRFHHQLLPAFITYESGALSDEVRDSLRRMGHQVRERERWSSAQCIEIAPDGTLKGVSDPRSLGAAIGY
jgi:gamma-glutamyltranspeptidase/glutathione hydrolase